MTCIKIKTKKYQTRKGPPYHAKDCKGQTKKGNDGKLYVSAVDMRGTYKWVPKDKGPRVTKKKGVKTYTMLDNGSDPFVADVGTSKVEIYRQKFVEKDGIETYERDKKVVDTPYKKIFIGDNDLRLNNGVEPKGMYPGNSILIKTGTGKYIYAGDQIYSFETRNGEEIEKYYSPVGNSAVPYPYAVGENYTYFMLDKETLPNELLDLKKDGYGQFYGHTLENEELRRKIESSKKKFKSKLIHKRWIF